MQDLLKYYEVNIKYIFKWVCLSIILGLICGFVGACFHLSVDYVTDLRMEIPWLFYCIPLGGIAIVFIYRHVGFHTDPGTNAIIKSCRQQETIPTVLAPTIFISTVITHLVGGSSGREGAALQIGGSIATTIGYHLNLKENDMTIMIMMGMTAVFSALFGTPLTATVFSMEVISVGVMHYSAFFPCFASALIATNLAQWMGGSVTHYNIVNTIAIHLMDWPKLFILAFLISVVSIAFVFSMHTSHEAFRTISKSPYTRVVIGAAMILVLSFAFGRRYLGGGMNIVEEALNNESYWYDFILKALFTAITIGCGFKGGEIVPTFVIGATFGTFVGDLLGIDPMLASALSMIAMFSCVVNCPIASIILSVEVFGSTYLLEFAFVITLCYVFSGYYSLYKAQEFVHSKFEPIRTRRRAS